MYYTVILSSSSKKTLRSRVCVRYSSKVVKSFFTNSEKLLASLSGNIYM